LEHSFARPPGPAARGEGPLAGRIRPAAEIRAAGDASARLADWLGEIAATSAGEALARLLADHSAVEGLIAGFAANAPYTSLHND